MRTQKPITVVLLLSLMTFIIEVERRFVPAALDALHSNLIVNTVESPESIDITHKASCRIVPAKEAKQISI